MSNSIGTAFASLEDLGWNEHFEHAFASSSAQAHVPARVTGGGGDGLRVSGPLGHAMVRVTGALLHRLDEPEGRPVVGDWVVLRAWQEPIVRVLPRRSCVRRKVAGARSDVQVVAANVDRVFVVTATGDDFNVRRLERYVAMVGASGADVSIVVNKADLFRDDVARLAEQAARVLGHASVFVTSAVDGRGVDDVRRAIGRGSTAALVGSSGVGKSALTNALLGHDVQSTGHVREHDERGRHTTGYRELFSLGESSGLLIDTPGMRELQLWTEDDAAPTGFDDIDALAAACRFRDCGHETEPGCAVLAAVARGDLDAARLASRKKLEREQRRLEARVSHRIAAASRRDSRATRTRRSGSSRT